MTTHLYLYPLRIGLENDHSPVPVPVPVPEPVPVPVSVPVPHICIPSWCGQGNITFIFEVVAKISLNKRNYVYFSVQFKFISSLKIMKFSILSFRIKLVS